MTAQCSPAAMAAHDALCDLQEWIKGRNCWRDEEVAKAAAWITAISLQLKLAALEHGHNPYVEQAAVDGEQPAVGAIDSSQPVNSHPNA